MQFQSTLPTRGATIRGDAQDVLVVRFNPRSPRGERLRTTRDFFNSFSVSIHAPHAGSDFRGQFENFVKGVSIHAPHAGSDGFITDTRTNGRSFNPRSPRGERRSRMGKSSRLRKFQSTLPTRGATASRPSEPVALCFNPRSPRGERLGFAFSCEVAGSVSIHAPHAGSDPRTSRLRFLLRVSIHAPHAGSDALHRGVVVELVLFQSTLPTRGATHFGAVPYNTQYKFQSTLPTRGATVAKVERQVMPRLFQSTLPTRGATKPILPLSPHTSQFQSTLPTRGATIVGDRT